LSLAAINDNWQPNIFKETIKQANQRGAGS